MSLQLEGQSNSERLYNFDPLQKKLTVRNASSFPREVFEHAEEVEILDMSFGHMTTLPDDLDRFKNMRVAFFSNHDFEEVPPVLSSCSNLEMVGFKSCKISTVQDRALPSGIRGIILTDNKLSSLPASIGDYIYLQKLMLAGNQLEVLPRELLSCQNLELLRLPINSLTSSPDWLFELPKLAWYTDAANPFHGEDRVHLKGLREIDWNEVEVGEKLGESAKNAVYKARLKNGEEVAIKLFGAGITTDGLPIDDMNASLLAGVHPNIIGGIGKLINTPNNQQGLVMPLVPSEFKSLGKPPDFKTFTRDVYPNMDALSLPFVTQVLSDIASVMEHCHSKGIMHGDLYAHNILVSENGQSYLGDFGAASLYEPNSSGGKLRQLIEVKGFGYLVDDLLSRVEAGGDQIEYANLVELRKACLNGNVSSRPSFAEIKNLLTK